MISLEEDQNGHLMAGQKEDLKVDQEVFHAEEHYTDLAQRSEEPQNSNLGEVLQVSLDLVHHTEEDHVCLANLEVVHSLVVDCDGTEVLLKMKKAPTVVVDHYLGLYMATGGKLALLAMTVHCS